MTFAYLILVHKNPNQVLRLVNILTANNTYFVIHIDKKTDETLFKSIIGSRENVFFCEYRKIVKWGGFSVTKAIMELIREMIVHIGFPDYVHLMSGQDFPLKSNEYIFDYFERHRGTNFLEYFPLPSPMWNDGMERIKYKWYVDDLGYTKAAELVRTQKPHNFLPDIQPYGGATWWSLTGECVAHIFSECNQESKLYEFYKRTVLSDEMLFHTFLMNSKYKSAIINYNLRKTDWSAGGPHPKTWTDMDFDELTASPRLFARKFDENKDDLILDKLEIYVKREHNLQKRNNKPAISIVMAMYNAEKYLRETIDSILKQTFNNFELIIVDDGSTDNSVNIVNGFNDERIKLILCEHDFINSLNTGLAYVQGKYIARMDVDDIMPVDRLEVQYEFMERNMDIDVCVGWMQCFGNSTYLEKVPADHDEIINRLIYRNFMMNPTSMINRSRLNNSNIKYERDYFFAEDYKMWIDLIKAGFRFAGMQRILNYYRTHNDQLTVTQQTVISKLTFKIQLEYVEYLMETIVESNQKYYTLMNSLIEAANENLIQSKQLINIVGNIHEVFLCKNKKQIANSLNVNYQQIKKYLMRDYKSIINKYKNTQYDNNSIKINNNVLPVWICWWDGEDAMPEIVKICFKSVCDNIGTHPVNLITKNNYHEFISLPDYIIEKVSKGIISITHLSDILRMCLLHDYGGLWLDATIFVSSTIESSIFEYDMVTVRNNSVCIRELKYKWTTFFIGGQKGHPFFAYMRDMLLEYWKRKKEVIDYFLTDYCIIVGYDKIPVIRSAINKISYSNPQVFGLSQNLDKAFDTDIYEQIFSDTDFHKLSWKRSYTKETDNGKLTFYGFLLNKKSKNNIINYK